MELEAGDYMVDLIVNLHIKCVGFEWIHVMFVCLFFFFSFPDSVPVAYIVPQ